MSRNDEPDPLLTGLAVLAGLGFAGWLAVQGLALVPVYLPFLAGLPLGALVGFGVRDRPRVPLLGVAVAGAVLALAALSLPAGTDWWADYDRDLRTKPAAVLAAFRSCGQS